MRTDNISVPSHSCDAPGGTAGQGPRVTRPGGAGRSCASALSRRRIAVGDPRSRWRRAGGRPGAGGHPDREIQRGGGPLDGLRGVVHRRRGGRRRLDGRRRRAAADGIRRERLRRPGDAEATRGGHRGRRCRRDRSRRRRAETREGAPHPLEGHPLPGPPRRHRRRPGGGRRAHPVPRARCRRRDRRRAPRHRRTRVHRRRAPMPRGPGEGTGGARGDLRVARRPRRAHRRDGPHPMGATAENRGEGRVGIVVVCTAGGDTAGGHSCRSRHSTRRGARGRSDVARRRRSRGCARRRRPRGTQSRRRAERDPASARRPDGAGRR